MSDLEASEYDYPPAAGRRAKETVIHTSANALAAGDISIPTADRSIPGYFARPQGDTNKPIVLVLSEAFGLHEHIRDIARRFAHEGYFAVATDLMVRQGNPASFERIDDLVRKLLLQIPDEQVMSDLDASLSWAMAQGANGHNASAVGFCWGGRWTWLYAAHRELAAGVAFYGIVDGDTSGIFPKDSHKFPRHPVGLVNDLKSPVLGLQGGRDDAIALSTIKTMIEQLGQGNERAQQSQFVVYPAAGHAFFADYREAYDSVAGPDAWKHCINWINTRSGRVASRPRRR